MSAELIALLVGLANGAIVLIKPIGRIHSRIDSLECETRYIAESIQRIEKRLESEIDRINARNP